MGFTIEGNTAVLDGEVDIDHALELQQALLALLADEEGDLVVDASRVASIDVAILQLLHSAWKTWEWSGRRLNIQAPSKAFLLQHKLSGAFLPLKPGIN